MWCGIPGRCYLPWKCGIHTMEMVTGVGVGCTPSPRSNNPRQDTENKPLEPCGCLRGVRTPRGQPAGTPCPGRFAAAPWGISRKTPGRLWLLQPPGQRAGYPIGGWGRKKKVRYLFILSCISWPMSPNVLGYQSYLLQRCRPVWVTKDLPRLSPVFALRMFIATQVQHSYNSSINGRILLTHVLMLCATEG